MSGLIRFKVRPGYGSKKLLVEVCGDHRASGFPRIEEILRDALHAEWKNLPDPRSEQFRKEEMFRDHFVTYWAYAEGSYEVDDDWGGLFVHVDENNAKVISDIEQALLRSGLFVKEEVNFADYARTPQT